MLAYDFVRMHPETRVKAYSLEEWLEFLIDYATGDFKNIQLKKCLAGFNVFGLANDPPNPEDGERPEAKDGFLHTIYKAVGDGVYCKAMVTLLPSLTAFCDEVEKGAEGAYPNYKHDPKELRKRLGDFIDWCNWEDVGKEDHDLGRFLELVEDFEHEPYLYSCLLAWTEFGFPLETCVN